MSLHLCSAFTVSFLFSANSNVNSQKLSHDIIKFYDCEISVAEINYCPVTDAVWTCWFGFKKLRQHVHSQVSKYRVFIKMMLLRGSWMIGRLVIASGSMVTVDQSIQQRFHMIEITWSLVLKMELVNSTWQKISLFHLYKVHRKWTHA